MKRVFVLCAVVGVAAYATGAWSASPPSPIEQRLQKNVTALQKQVKTLQKQQKTGTSEINALGDALVGTLLIGVCSDELTADALQGTWQVVDQISAALQAGKTYFGVQTPVTATINGQDICSAGAITRSQVLPPTIAGYQALLATFHSSNLKLLRTYLHRK